MNNIEIDDNNIQIDQFLIRIAGDLHKALDHKHRREIVEALINTDKQSLTWDEIYKITGLNPNTLSFHLKILSQCAMVQRWEYIKDVLEDNVIGHYQLTELGEKYINFLLSIFGNESVSEKRPNRSSGITS